MKTRYLLLSIFIMVMINAAWIWRLDKNSTESNERMNETRTRFIEANRELYLMNRDWKFSMKSDGRHLPDHLTVRTLEGQSLDLGNEVNGCRKLVLVLSDRHCSTCVDQLLFMVKNEIPEFYRKNILVLFSPEDSLKVTWLHRQKMLPGARFLEIHDRSLQLPMDSLSNPYFFTSGPDMVAGLTYTPYPTLEIQTLEYLRLIKERYFNQ